MKKLLRNGLLFFALATGIYLVAFWALCKIELGGTPLVHRVSKVLYWKGGDSYERFHKFQSETKNDVVIVGSSHAYRGYDPALFAEHGYRAYNLGSSAQSPMNSYYIVEQYLDSSNTGLLIFDVYDGAFEVSGLESTADLTQNISSDLAAMKMACALKDPRGMNMLTLRAIQSGAEPIYTDEGKTSAGFTGVSDSVETELNYAIGGKQRPELPQGQYLEKLLNLCRERHIPVVLTNHPFPKEKDDGRHAHFATWINETAGPFGVEYLDFAFDHSLHSKHHFYDQSHLNLAGVAQFNPQLIMELEEKELLSRP